MDPSSSKLTLISNLTSSSSRPDSVTVLHVGNLTLGDEFKFSVFALNSAGASKRYDIDFTVNELAKLVEDEEQVRVAR